MSILKQSLMLVLASMMCSLQSTENAAKELSNMKDLQTLLQDDSKPTVIIFYTNWCPACKGMKPIFQAAAEKYKDKAHFAKVDVTNKEFNNAVDQFCIQGIPTIIYKDVGYKKRDQFNKQLDSFLSSTEPESKKQPNGAESAKQTGRNTRRPNQKPRAQQPKVVKQAAKKTE
jgi:thiol-disulfide isomerase/thioredoxin